MVPELEGNLGMNPLIPRLGAVAVGAVLLTAAYNRTNSASVMTEAANRLLVSLTPEQRAKVVIPFDDAERGNWFYTPVERKGLTLGEMSPYQTPPGLGTVERRTEPVGLHEGRDHHEPGRCASHHGKGRRKAPQSGEVSLLDLRHPVGNRNLGIPG